MESKGEQTQEWETSIQDKQNVPLVQESLVVPEHPRELKHQIAKLKEDINTIVERQKAIRHFQKMYGGVQDEHLTEADYAIKETKIAPLQEQLAALERKQKSQQGSLRNTIRKVAAFLSL